MTAQQPVLALDLREALLHHLFALHVFAQVVVPLRRLVVNRGLHVA